MPASEADEPLDEPGPLGQIVDEDEEGDEAPDGSPRRPLTRVGLPPIDSDDSDDDVGGRPV